MMRPRLAAGAVHLLFFLSGAAALVYQVVWMRSLALVFGSSHQAVTAVLAIFMAGLALGGYVVGRLVDRVERPLRLYGLLELGIAASAVVFVGVTALYPAAYVALARGREDAPLYLAAIRTVFAVVALIVPTTLMGGTLPVLARFVSRRPEALRTSLAALYGVNTLGAVLGAALAAFVLLRLLATSTTLWLAVATNVVIGLASLALQARLPSAATEPAADVPRDASISAPDRSVTWPARMLLAGIAIGGFCALGYEVLWTRVLTLVVGASVYSFTVMLIAFLGGIALGSHAYGLLRALVPAGGARPAHGIVAFGLVQIAIGITALGVTVLLRDLPANAVRLQELVLGSETGSFGARMWVNLALAFAHMLVPAFFMGVAFPLAGEVYARYRGGVGRAVGEVLAWNTVGAIAGAVVSGAALVYLVGIERALQLLTVVNVGAGLVVLASLRRSRRPAAAAAAVTVAALAVLALNPGLLRVWDTSYFAIFRSNQPEAFRTAEMVREAVENTDVLYYAEGVESIVSVIRVKGGEQAFLTNGRVEASSHPQAMQNQFALGHLPMLLARDPRRVLVVGLGSGMTVGATSVHPTVQRVTLAEIEPRVIGVARTFAAYNHRVLDDPKLRIVFADGRNFLMTTAETFDVITADPIHPWFRGAGYLYTTEYFALAAARLNPGGVIAQWLPLYELSPDDLRSIVRTFQARFRHTQLWLTHYDAQLIGSNAPLGLDESDLARRMAVPAVARDLERVTMGSVGDLLGYFVMGTEGMARFSRDGGLNTDDRPHLEFSAPLSIAKASVMGANVRALSAHRESLLPYLHGDDRDAEARRRRAGRQFEAATIADPALALFLDGHARTPEFAHALARLERDFPDYAPGRFLRAEREAALALEPRPLDSARLTLATDGGERVVVELAAVLVPISPRRAAVMFVDGRSRVVYGQRYVDGGVDVAARLAAEVMTAVRTVYREEADLALKRRDALPPASRTLQKIDAAIDAAIAARAAGS